MTENLLSLSDTLRKLAEAINPPKVEIQRYEIELDPPVDVFNVVVSSPIGGSWHESFRSEEELDAFLLGIKVCCSMFGLFVADFEIPSEAVSKLCIPGKSENTPDSLKPEKDGDRYIDDTPF